MNEAILKLLTLRFPEAIAFFQNKLAIPTEAWNDVQAQFRDYAFTVAGVTSAQMLQDFQKAIDKQLSQESGINYRQFLKEFGAIAEAGGWQPREGVAHRGLLVLQTNMRTAYSAGRNEQMNMPHILKKRPYRMRMHRACRNPRPLHLAWHRLILRHDDPFIAANPVPGGFGCFPSGTLVETSLGWHPIECVSVGTDVVTATGQLRSTTALHSRFYAGELVRIVFKEGGFCATTPNHRILTTRGWVEAGSLDISDVVVKIFQLPTQDNRIEDIDKPNPGFSNLSVPQPTISHNPSASATALNSKIEVGNENIDPSVQNVVIVADGETHLFQMTNEDAFGLGWRINCIRMGDNIFVVEPLQCRTNFGLHFWSPCGRSRFQLLGGSASTFASLLCLSTSWMFAFSDLLIDHLSRSLSAFFPQGGIPFVLNASRIASVAVPTTIDKHGHDRSIADMPYGANLVDRFHFFDVIAPQSVVNVTPLKSFNSSDLADEDSVSVSLASIPHDALQVIRVEKFDYEGYVYNLSVWEDESYNVKSPCQESALTAHNCGCQYFTLSDRDLEKRGGLSETPEPGTKIYIDKQGNEHEISNGVDPGFEHPPGMPSVGETLDRIQQELLASVPEHLRSHLQ